MREYDQSKALHKYAPQRFLELMIRELRFPLERKKPEMKSEEGHQIGKDSSKGAYPPL